MSDTDDLYRDHDREIDDLRVALHRELTEALSTLARAAHLVRQLTSNAVYDIEFTEGADGSDAAAFVEDALRAARAARRITAHLTELP